MTWQEVSLGEVLPFRYGKGLPARDRSESGEYAVVSSAGSTGSHNVPLTTGPSIVIGRKGTIGSVYYCPNPVWPIDTTFYVEPSSSTDIRFAYYLLSSLPLNEMNNDSAVPGLNRAQAESLEISLPTLPEQRAIAAMLGALDDKIESNRRSGNLLTQLFSAEFSRTLASAGPLSTRPLDTIATITKGRSYKSTELQDSPVALVTLKSIDRNGGYKHDGLKPYIGAYKPEQIVSPGEIVVAQTDLTQGAEVVGRGVRVPASGEHDTLVASLDLSVLRPKDGTPNEYLLGLLSSEAFRQHCRRHVTGTTVLHLAKDAMPTWLAPVVSPEKQEGFAATARALLDRLDAYTTENVRLTSARDALLRELLSGRVRAPTEGAKA